MLGRTKTTWSDEIFRKNSERMEEKNRRIEIIWRNLCPKVEECIGWSQGPSFFSFYVKLSWYRFWITRAEYIRVLTVWWYRFWRTRTENIRLWWSGTDRRDVSRTKTVWSNGIFRITEKNGKKTEEENLLPQSEAICRKKRYADQEK